MRIVFVSWWWPYPANNGSKLRIYHLLRQLATRHKVALLSFAEADEATPEQVAHMQEFCAQVEVVAKPHYQPDSLKALAGYLSPWPRSLIDTYSPLMTARVAECVAAQPPDVMIVSELNTIQYLDSAQNIPAILEDAEVTHVHNRVEQATSRSARFRARLTLFKIERMLRRTTERGTAITVVSTDEKALLQQMAADGARIEVIPNGVDTQANRPADVAPQSDSLIYPGAVTYNANYNAVAYFIQDVLPLVRQRIPGAHFTVTGGTGQVDVSDLAAQPGVTFSGYLPEVAPAVQASWATVVPLRQGGGTRLKILESMALGTPVISTSKGAEGLNIHPGDDILIEDDPAGMAEAICRLLRDEVLRQRLALAGRSLVEREYDWAVIGRGLLDLIDDIIDEEVHHGKHGAGIDEHDSTR